MTVKDAVRNTYVIEGTLQLSSIDAIILIDSGATKSFVSTNFAHKLQLKMKPLEQTLSVEITNKEIITMSQSCSECEIKI